jgi:hypothetical protein
MKKLHEVDWEVDGLTTIFTVEDPETGNKIFIPIKNELLLSLEGDKICQIISAIIEQELKNK